MACKLRWVMLANVLLLGIVPALAHSWYPSECCSGRDCFPVSIDDLVEMSDGNWKYLPLDLVFPKEKVRPSQDRHMHVCIGNYDFNRGQPLCAFVLQGA